MLNAAQRAPDPDIDAGHSVRPGGLWDDQVHASTVLIVDDHAAFRASARALLQAEGRVLALPDAGSGRSVTVVERQGQPVAALVHDPAVMEDPGLLEAVTSAAQLAAANAQLRAEVQARVEELAASRRRILAAGDEERRRLKHRLHEGSSGGSRSWR
jgi:hypothetical protein